MFVVGLGRPKKDYSDDVILIVEQWRDGLIGLQEAMQLLNFKRSSFYKVAKKME